VTDQDEERGKQTLINKESETADKKSKGLKSKKSYQTDYEGARLDEDMKDEGGGVVRDQKNQDDIKNEVEDERVRKHAEEKDALLSKLP